MLAPTLNTTRTGPRAREHAGPHAAENAFNGGGRRPIHHGFDPPVDPGAPPSPVAPLGARPKQFYRSPRRYRSDSCTATPRSRCQPLPGLSCLLERQAEPARSAVDYPGDLPEWVVGAGHRKLVQGSPR